MNQIQLKFLGYFVREINFFKNDHFKAEKINLDMKLSKNSTYLEKNRVRLNINVKIFEDAVSKNYPLIYLFYLQVSSNIIKSILKKIIKEKSLKERC